MKKFVLAVGLAAGVAACSGKKEADQMSKYADQICTCKTVDCAEKILPEIEKFSNANAGKEVDKAAADRYNAALERVEKCMTKLQTDAEKAGDGAEKTDK
jgi:hypothetical protein